MPSYSAALVPNNWFDWNKPIFRNVYLPIFQDIVPLNSTSPEHFLTSGQFIYIYIDVNFKCFWYTWGQNVLLQNSTSKTPEMYVKFTWSDFYVVSTWWCHNMEPLSASQEWERCKKKYTNTYRQVSNIRRTKTLHLKYSRTVLRLSLPNRLKPDVKSRMKM